MAGFLRKIGAVLLSVLLVFSLAACGASDNTNDRGKTEDLSVDGQKNVSETQTATDSTETKTNEEQTSDEVMSDETTGGSDMLVIYFSRTGEQYNVGVIDKGNTAIAAEMIAEQTGADIFELLPEEDYYRRKCYGYPAEAHHRNAEENRNSSENQGGCILPCVYGI